ncbi:MAG: thiamine-phosphate kinase [Gammaproteobacteria bacterium]|jgi:thiamine-monophosphate kinase
MTRSEFSLIDKFFKDRGVVRDDVTLAIGDDAAVANVPAGFQLITAVDTLVDGVHFPRDSQAFDIGYKALAVNLSDMAAMGAEPAWATLALTMPQVDESWLQQFCDGFFKLADEFNLQLIGGDTTQGPLTVSVQLMGLVPQGEALKRSGAKPGDRIFVSGNVGDAALGLQIQQQNISSTNLTTEQKQTLLARLHRPEPRINLGIMLRNVASAAIDVSDGLLADLNHMLNASQLGAKIQLECVPISQPMREYGESIDQLALSLAGGDDYELCFTVPESKLAEIQKIHQQLKLKVSEIGVVEEKYGLRLLNKGVAVKRPFKGFEHFSRC